MKLVTVETWIKEKFEIPRPSKRTVWRWIRDGKLEAKKIGRRYYLTEESKVKN
jgi:hypothetical protein